MIAYRCESGNMIASLYPLTLWGGGMTTCSTTQGKIEHAGRGHRGWMTFFEPQEEQLSR